MLRSYHHDFQINTELKYSSAPEEAYHNPGDSEPFYSKIIYT